MHFKRFLWSLIVAAVILSVLSLSAYAAGEELLSGYQTEIDRILVDYLGTTSMTTEEIRVIVDQMDWETYQSARWEISLLEDNIYEAFASGELSESTAQQFRDGNPTICVFSTVLEEKNSRDNYLGVLKDLTPLTNVVITASNVSGNSTKVTITTTGGFFSSSSGSATVTNNTTQKLTFSYSFNSGSDWKVGQTSVSSGGTYELMPGESIAFSHKTGSGLWESAYIYLENLTLSDVAAASNVTVYFDSGTASVAGTTVSNGATVQIASTGATVTATESNFVAWINKTTNQIVSTSASFTFKPDADISIKAVHGPAARFLIGTYAANAGYLYETLPAATAAASSGSNKTVILANNGTLPALTDNPTTTDVDESIYTIPAGVTLLIPYDAANTLCTDKPTVHNNAYTNPTVYRTLTMSSGANITVNGAISVSGSQSSKYAHNGMPSGPLGFIKMNSGSKITVENGANLYVWGYITGSGSVEIKSGGNVHECFQIADYRGGDATSSIVGKDDDYGVFPFNQYYLQNVEVPMTLHAGAKENGYGSVYVTLADTQEMSIPFIGSADSMFIIDSGYIVKDYIEGTGRTEIKVSGTVNITEVSIDMKVSLIGGITIDTSKYALPIPHHFTVRVESGSINMKQSIAFLPGSELYIKENASGTLGTGKKVYVYDLDQWLYNDGANGYSGTKNLPYMQLKYVPGGDGTEGRLKDALIQVDGTVDASAGAVYVTGSGANIYSTGTGKVTVAATTNATVYQVTTGGSDGTDITGWPEIAMQPAILKDGDGTAVSTANTSAADPGFGEGTYTYYADTQKWCPPGHRYGDGVVTAPTCTTAGYTTHTCIACGNSYTDTEVAALGHTWDWTTYKCTVCDCAAIQCNGILLDVRSEIQLHLKFAVHQDLLNKYTNLRAYVTEQENTIDKDGDAWDVLVTDLPTDDDRYVVKQGIAAGEMTGLVKVQFKSGDTVIPVYDKYKNAMVNSVEKTVVSFAEAALAAEGDSGRNVALSKAALTFGGYAQSFYGTHTDNLAYSFFGSEAPNVTVSSWDGYSTKISSTEGFALTPTTQKLNLDSMIYMRMYFEGNTDGYTATLHKPSQSNENGVDVNLDFKTVENGRICLDIEDIPPAYWNDTYKITISNGSNSYTIETSVLAWCARCVAQSSNTAQVTMAQAMYHYAVAADTYFSAKNGQ